MNLGNKSMNTTMILSEQRCGTSYLSNKMNGMFGQVVYYIKEI
jgi:uncharacterized FlgJ-related protein